MNIGNPKGLDTSTIFPMLLLSSKVVLDWMAKMKVPVIAGNQTCNPDCRYALY
jgi:hypothetical protein